MFDLTTCQAALPLTAHTGAPRLKLYTRERTPKLSLVPSCYPGPDLTVGSSVLPILVTTITATSRNSKKSSKLSCTQLTPNIRKPAIYPPAHRAKVVSASNYSGVLSQYLNRLRYRIAPSM